MRVAAAVVFALFALPAHADWRRDYDSAQKAIEKGNWAEAEQLMKSAAGEEPDASARKRFQGTRIALYAPQHFAGVAAFRQGACGRALGYLDDPANRAVEAAVGALASEASEIRGKCGGSAVAVAPEPPKPAPDTPRPDTRPVPEPPKPAPDTRVVAEPPKPVPTPVAPPTPTPATRSAPPAALRSILAAYLAGNYDAAVKVGDGGITDARARAMLLLVRAASWQTRADLRGGDATMLANAEADIRASRRLARLDLDPNLFSPRMRALAAWVR
jgi:hypothetical protein